MAIRFAVKTGVWSDTTVWDSGALPTSADIVYANSYSVSIDTDVDIQSFNNNTVPIVLPNLATPPMTSNTQPTGSVISSNSSGTAYYAFNQDNSTSPFWASGVSNTGWLGYTFPTAKVIKRYFHKITGTASAVPKTWTFEGSNDGFATPGVQLDQVLSYTTNANYTSVLLSNTTAYTSYRINVTATQGGGEVRISEFEMTESTLSIYGTPTGPGGSFNVPGTLSGTRNIIQRGSGISTANSIPCFYLNHTGSNIVNLNTVTGGYIINPQWGYTSNYSPLIHQGTGVLNFNGDLWGNQYISIFSSAHTLSVTNGATINVIGNVYSPKQVSTTYSSTINVTGIGAVINVTGNLINTSNATVYANQYNIYTSVANVIINLIGNATGYSSFCINHSGATGTVNVIGTLTVQNNTSIAAVYIGSLTTTFTASTPIINIESAMAVFAYRMRLNNAYSNSWTFVDQTNASRDLTFGTPSTGPYPAEADVRYNVAYGASPTRYGTCHVPAVQYVSQGVLVGNTAGTAYINVADVWNVLTSTITTSGSIGERLKNASTVQTTGDQIASYQV